jgi:hypothetical protein
MSGHGDHAIVMAGGVDVTRYPVSVSLSGVVALLAIVHDFELGSLHWYR